MEIDQAGQPYQNHQLAVPGRSDTHLVPLDHDAAGPSSMEVDENYARELIPVPPRQVTTHSQRPETNIVSRGRIEMDEYSHNHDTCIVPRRRHRTPPASRFSDAIITYADENQFDYDEANRESKRLRLTSEQANAAIESPTTYQVAFQNGEAVQWKDAIASEFKSLDEKKTWKIVDRPKDQKVIGCKRVFAIKRDEHGAIQRYKARLVAQGFRQTAGVDYKETCAPVASTSSIRVFLSVCVQLG